MDELAHSFEGIGAVRRSKYENTYDLRGRSISSYCNRRVARRLAAEWRTLSADCIHLNKQNLEDGLDLLQAAELARVPHLCTIHLTQSARYLGAVLGWIRDHISHRALREYSGLLVTVLEQRRRELAQIVRDSKQVRLVANGVPLIDLAARDERRRAIRQQLAIDDETLLYLAVGRMVAQKRPIKFLEVADKVHRRLQNTLFLWIGEGALSGLWDARVAEFKLNGVVRHLPWQKDVSPFLIAADAFLHVAEFEGLPLAMLEAMSAALPCAVTENLLQEMPFLDEKNCVAIGESDAWLGEISDRAQLRARGEAARRLAEERFSFETMAKNYEALYRETVAGNSW